MDHYIGIFDGACEPVNPGDRATFGVTIDKNGERIYRRAGFVGEGPGMSNNLAEYAGLADLLEYLLRNHARGHVSIYGDSMLVIKQMTRAWKAKRGRYLDYHKRAVAALEKLKQSCNVSFAWIPREENTECERIE